MVRAERTMLKIGLLYPDLLGTYGDGGNAQVLAYRARARGIATEIVETRVGDALVDADLYLLGGGEDGPQRLAADLLRESDFVRRVGDGASVFAVCAGLQILGTSFAVEGDAHYPGVGLVDAVTTRGARRSVGDMAAVVGDNTLVGFENHGGVTALGEGLAPFGTVQRGVGNDGHVDGYKQGRIIATYAHGPALALNPWCADVLLEMALDQSLEPLHLIADDLHAQRVRAVLGN